MGGHRIVVEFVGADARPLGRDDTFLHGSFSEDDVAQFYSDSAAHAAVARAKNRRAGSTVSVISPAAKRVLA